MTDDLYERYKEALRTGHVAVLRGRLEEAIEAYRTAASIAPARALPHSSLGGVFLRLNRVDDALAEYAAAVARAPQDEGALLGQAEALAAVGRFADAATALDRVAQIQEAAGRLPEATDTIRRALELDEAPERIRRQRSLLRQIRLSAGDQAAEQALARALRLREEPAEPASPSASAFEPVLGPTGSTAARPEEVVRESWAVEDGAERGSPGETVTVVPQPSGAEPGPAVGELESRTAAEIPTEQEPAAAAVAEAGAPAEPAIEQAEPVAAQADAIVAEPESEPAAATDVVGPATWTWPRAIVWESEEDVAAASPRRWSGAPQPGPDHVAAQQAPTAPAATTAEHGLEFDLEPELGQVPVMAEQELSASAAPLVAEPDADELVGLAEAADAGGKKAEKRRLLVAAAREYAREGRYDAGLDTAQQLLREYPSDVDVHLVLVELYISRNWETLAAEKLLLLGRLADLDDDEETRLRLCAAASQAFPDNGRLASLCA